MMGFCLFMFGLAIGTVFGQLFGYQDGWEARSEIRENRHRRRKDDR